MIYTAASAAGEGETEGRCNTLLHPRLERGDRGTMVLYTAASAAREGERGGECDIHCCIRGWRGGERGRV